MRRLILFRGFMAAITFVQPTNWVGDAFLAPLKWCGDNWQTLNASENSEGLNKIFTCASKIILGSLLALATALAFVPSAMGSLIKSCTETPVERVEQWNVAMDASLKERCRQLGINDPLAQNDNIERGVCRNISEFEDQNRFLIGHVLLISAHRDEHPLPSKHIEIKNVLRSWTFLNHLVNCFQASENRLSIQEQANAASKLSAIVLGDRRASLTERDISDMQNKIAPISKMEWVISENLEQMTLSFTKA